MNSTSHAEIQRILRPAIEEIASHTTFAEYEESSLPPIRYQDIVGEKGAPQKPKPAFRRVHLMDDSIRLLKDIVDHPSDGLARHYERLSWGIEKGNDRLGELKNAGLVTVKKVPTNNPNGGRARLVASLTPEGRQFLAAADNSRKESNE